jgi:hypothetical protein
MNEATAYDSNKNVVIGPRWVPYIKALTVGCDITSQPCLSSETGSLQSAPANDSKRQTM